MSNRYILDTNVVVDLSSAELLHALNIDIFAVSNLVLKDEILLQIPNIKLDNIKIIYETPLEIKEAYELYSITKRISAYDAINIIISKRRKYILVTGDKALRKVAENNHVKCIGTITIIKEMLYQKIISQEKVIRALIKIKQDSSRRIPREVIDKLLNELNNLYEKKDV